MVFGDIVEPSTRALLYDEDEDIVEENLDWKIKTIAPPTYEALLIAETPFINKIVQHILLSNKMPLTFTTENVIAIYKFEKYKYVALCKPKSDSSIGRITEALLPWINAAKKCFAFTTQPTASYQNKNMIDRPFCMLRMLSTTLDGPALCPKLETPNLITGIGANCLSYCVFAQKDCSLFVGYVDHAPIDSVNSQPFIDLLEQIGFDSHGKMYKLTDKLPQNNVYI